VSQPTPAARRARGAVGALFFANGALYANVVPRYPDLKADLDLSNAAFGSAIGAYGFGALVFGLLGGVLVRRWGSRRVAWVSTIALAGNITLLGRAPSWLALGAVLAVGGALDAFADIGANAHGLRVERRYGRSILNSLHGIWSVGAVAGGAMGAAAAGVGLAVSWHLAGAALLFVLLAIAASRFLLPGPDDRAVRTHSAPGRARAVAGIAVVLGLIAASAQVMEEATATWGAVYLRTELGAAAAVGGLGFIALQVSQTAGRLLGDRVVTRFGDRAVARAGAALAGGAMTGALAAAGITSTLIAFGLVGLGIGTVIPAAMRRADALLPHGTGLMLVGSVLRVALLVAPPVVGVVADAASLRVALTVIPLAAALILVLAPALGDPRRS